MTDATRKAANGEYYAGECDTCGYRTRDPFKIGEPCDSPFCMGGVFEEF